MSAAGDANGRNPGEHKGAGVGAGAARGSPEAGPQDPKALFTRLQTIVLFALVALLAAGLFVLKHSQRLDSDGILLTEGDASVYQFRVDANAATWEQLALAPGIGPERAKRIVKWREANGPFRAPGDLEKVPGIGPKTAATLAEYLVFEE